MLPAELPPSPQRHRRRQLCLGVWKDDPIDGAALTFTSCAHARKRTQQWTFSADGRVQPVSAPELCATATPFFTTAIEAGRLADLS